MSISRYINIRYHENPFSAVTQKIINWFVFFIAFPAIDILGNSLTFYLFILVAIRIGSFIEKPFKGKILLLLFFMIAFFSTLFPPFMARYQGFSSSAKILIQYGYWIFVALFFIGQKERIDMIQVSRWVLVATLISCFCFYFFGFKFNSPFLNIHLRDSRNGFVFNLICTIPISFFYIINTWGKKIALLSMPFFLLIMLLTDGRSAAIVIILELLLIGSIILPNFHTFSKIMIPVFVLLFFISQTDESQIYLDELADKMESVNPRFANLLRGKEEGDLSFDKSWLTRKIMVDKGIEIFREYPLRGIGLNNFIYFDSKLATLDNYERLGNGSVEYFNGRSAHNSYIQLLSETGIFGFSIMIILLAVPLLFFLSKFFTGKIDYQYLPFVSLLGISMHFYAIAAFTGAIAWIVIGLSWGVLNNIQKYK